MRNRLNILFFCALMMVGTGFVSCSEDDLGPSIFDTNDYPLDKTKYSFPLDTFLKVSFLEGRHRFRHDEEPHSCRLFEERAIGRAGEIPLV